MQNLFSEVSTLDRRTVERYGLSEEVMMEHAAMAMERLIRERMAPGASVLLVCGSGNNGADGLALARLLDGDYPLRLLLPAGAGSPLCRLQLSRLDAMGIAPSEAGEQADVIVDALFGSGLSRPLSPEMARLIGELNAMEGFKIACDVPSGLFPDGRCDDVTFRADVTVSMGGLKRGMYSDEAKSVCGEIRVGELGVPRRLYETASLWQVLEPDDLKLPLREDVSAHKGSFGHLAVVCGEKTGAAVIAGSAALRFGAGLVSLISNEQAAIPFELMQSHLLPATTTAMALGMGLGSEFGDDELTRLLDHDLPLVLDADIFYHPLLAALLARRRIVLTPHPKEFTQLLRACGIADIDVAALQRDRFGYAERFCAAYPEAVLLLKGSNVIIGYRERFFVNPHGTVALAKGGSGDVLSGLIGALLAQGADPLEAALQGSLAHAMAARHFDRHNYALTPFDLIERISSI